MDSGKKNGTKIKTFCSCAETQAIKPDSDSEKETQ